MINDEAVEAAAWAIRDDDWPDYEDQIHHPIKDYMSNARAALQAAAPHMLGERYDRERNISTIIEFIEARIAEDEELATTDTAEMSRSTVSIQFDCPTQERFNPTRVLAECAAKRAIIGWWNNGVIGEVEVDGELTNPLLPLAAVYKDHPDYQQEWAPRG